MLTLDSLRELPATIRETGRDLDQLADATVNAWREGNPWQVMTEFVALMTALFFIAIMGLVVTLPLTLFLVWLSL